MDAARQPMVTGVMVLIASRGFSRAMRGAPPARRVGVLLAVFGAALIASGIFPPDPMVGFPPGTNSNEASLSGILHLACGAVGFGLLAAAALAAAGWFSARGQSGLAAYSRISAGIVVAGFLAGAALSSGAAGVLALWVAVVGGWLWLAVTSISVYRTVPHPDAHRRTATSSDGLPQ